MQGSDNPAHSQRVAIVLTVLTGAIATAVAYVGTRESTSPPPAWSRRPGPRPRCRSKRSCFPTMSPSCPLVLTSGHSWHRARSATRPGW